MTTISAVPGRRRTLAVVVAGASSILALAVMAGGLYWVRGRNPEPLRGPDQHPAPALAASDDQARGSIRFDASQSIDPGPELTVTVDAPPGATEMQVGFDPTFSTVAWQPVAPSLRARTDDTGFQMLFGRFRSGPGSVPSPISVDGVTVDPTYQAATASAHGLHRASWVRPLTSGTVMVRIEAGRVQRGVQQPYDFDQPPSGDQVGGWFGIKGWFGPTTVQRDGQLYGRQVAGSDDLLRPFDSLVGRPLAVADLVAGQWRITSPDDPAYASAQAPVMIGGMSRPAGTGVGPDDKLIVPLVHDLVLRLPQPLQVGRHYRIEPPADLVEAVDLAVAPTDVSPAVHANQNGYAPGDRLKVAYLSGLPDAVFTDAVFTNAVFTNEVFTNGKPPDAGRPVYAEGTAFGVVEVESGRTVYRGQTTGRSGGAELGQGDLTGSAVFELDFSAVDEPGRYQVCVDGVGCSEEFPVRATVWRDLTVTVARAMYHQRSGLALGPPFTAIGRPRPFHPDDGKVVNDSTFRALDGADRDQGQVFAGLVNGQQPTVVADAWGGHFDAGDWDRRIQHLYYVRAVAELVQRRPQVLAQLDLDIPESGDAVPDLLDEGLWSLDFYRRLQGPDGSIRGGVEGSEHPQTDNTSWSDDLALFAFAPDAWSSYLYAGVAAQVAVALAPYDQQRADGYALSAQQAMTWAEAQQPEPRYAELIRSERSVAAAALVQLTGNQHWRDVFVEATDLDDGVDRFLSCHEHGRCDAAWIYWSTDPAWTDPELRSLIEQSFIATADEILAGADTTAFGWTLANTSVPLIWGLGVGGAPKATALVRAYEITGDERYREGALRSAAVSLGANPMNTVYLTGVGRNPVGHPLIVDVANGGLPVWAGTPVYGDHQLNHGADEGWVDNVVLGPAGVRPLGAQLPYLWQWFDVSNVAMFNEFTVFQSHAEAIYTFGLLS